ncbi:MAG: hypothetical protein ACO1RA_06865 [Planctomycetaceae bacterium]
MNRILSLVVFALLFYPGNIAWGKEKDFHIDLCFTHGKVGPIKDSHEFLISEPLMISIKVQGATVDAEGLVHCSFNASILDAEKSVVHAYPKMDWNSTAIIPGKELSLPATLPLAGGLKAGEYFLQFSAKDTNNDSTTKALIPFQIVPSDQMKIGTIHLSKDQAGTFFAGKCYNVGEIFVANFRLQNPNTSGNKWKLQLGAKLLDHQKQVLNDQIPPLIIETFPTSNGQVRACVGGHNLNVAGSYYMQLEVIDLETNQRAEQIIPFVVIDPETVGETSVASQPEKRLVK